MHQWNLYQGDADFWIEGAEGATNITEKLAGIATVECSYEIDRVRGRDVKVLVVVMRKTHSQRTS